MSARTAIVGSQLGSALASPLRSFHPGPQMASKQLSTTARPSAGAALKQASRPHARTLPSSPSSFQQIGLRTNSTAASKKTNDVKLDWNSFFKLRASRRRYSLASSIASSLVTTTVGVQVLSSQDLESLGAQVMGLDPFVVLGLATAACGAIGWLAGPFVGNGVWGLVYRRFKPSVVVKEKEFFDRIRRFRVDPSTNSIANPVPDYYGEKIGSVQGYRQWLKDQRAYNRKRRNFIA
ncbi:Mitochondrial import protein Pam17 [Penicillium alfredii]|uniref:Presequence translocated-associated motor subunit PAM17 n=1 Tax=Penicillium alfredii TaxID=1506179 RepID=A0A9W9GAU6_9EURO|nr:Mitochondrial import protein Pam17 [Penicillium alfredii]KAJ5115345.1 Mitochondrial import protein Pam17 [Penicillium alfredii]